MPYQNKYFDISPTITEELAVFPGDVAFKQESHKDFYNGNNYKLSSVITTLHLGAHADAPNHYHPDGQDISERDLNYYLGPCQVITVESSKKSYRLTKKDISHIKINAPRILFKTNSFTNPNQWDDNFTALSPELVDYLAEQNVILVGIDTPSVDVADSKLLETHQAIYKNNMAILEGLMLNTVTDGLYTLIALPLKIKNADASPVRAILLP